MDKPSSVNKWKGSNSDSKHTQMNDINKPTTNYQNSFEFLDMSSCDESQKLKLKNTLNSPSSSTFPSTQRDRYRSYLSSRSNAIKPTAQQYTTIQYHANNPMKSQKPNYQSYPSKQPNSLELDSTGPISTRPFSSEANSFNSKNNSNSYNNFNTMSNTTNISSKRLDDRHYLNPQEKLNKWQMHNKKPPYAGVKDPIQANPPLKWIGGVGKIDSQHHQHHHQLQQQHHHQKDSSRDSAKSFTNMSPPLTNFQTSTTTTTSSSSPSSMPVANQANIPYQPQHYNPQQIQYGPAPLHSVYSHGTVPLMQHYPNMHPHSGHFVASNPTYSQHVSEGQQRNDMPREIQNHNDHQGNPSSQHSTRGTGGANRRGRSRGGSNTSRRDYAMRQNNQQHQSHQSNDFGQQIMDHSQQPTVVNANPYQQFYIHYPHAYYGPGANVLPATATAQNLTGQPLFAFQQPLYVSQYGAPYPIMYNMMPTQPHGMPHPHQEMADGEPGQETNGQPTVLQQIPWSPIAYQDPHQTPIFQHSPHLGQIEGEEIDMSDYQMQLVNPPEDFHMIANPEEENESSGDPQAAYNEEDEAAGLEFTDDTRIIEEKTRDLIIQSSQEALNTICIENAEIFSCNQDHEEKIVPNHQDIGMISTSNIKVELEMQDGFVSNTELSDVKNVEASAVAWGANVVPNPSAPSARKQTNSVSVSAIPNKDLPPPANEKGNYHDGKDRDVKEKLIPQVAEKTATTFSNVTANNMTPMSQTSTDHIKTELKQSDIRSHPQAALSEKAKQQIVTTITGVGAISTENTKLVQVPVPSPGPAPPATLENNSSKQVDVPKPKPPPSVSAPAKATWAGLFGSGDLPATSKPVTNFTSVLNTEAQKPPTAKNPEPLLIQPPSPQVPGAMSYSAVSAQSLTPASTQSASVTSIPTQMSSSTKNLPQGKMNTTNYNNNSSNNADTPKPEPIDQHALKLGDFFSKYKIDSSSISLLPRGLLNKSNYCYINAILQALVACPPFYHLMKSIPHTMPSYKHQTKTPVTDAMIELVSNYSLLPYRKWVPREKGKKDDVPEITRESAFEPAVILKMLQALRTEMFPVEGRQEDAEEFLSFILNRMNDEMIELKKLVEKPKLAIIKPEENGDDVNGNVTGDDDNEWQVISGTRNKSTITRTTDFGRSPISDIFGGKLRVRVHREGDHSSDNIEPFFTLKLVIEKASSVREALELLVGRDQLEGVTCSRTNQEVAAWQQVTIEELPVVLILHLKCFDYKKDSCTKILKTVEFPVELKLDQKIMASKIKYQQKQKQYKLFAVTYHDGKEASKGHYITDVFHVGYSSWIRYDDSTVKAVPESNVLHPKSPRVPYLLYYRRYDTIGGNREREQLRNPTK